MTDATSAVPVPARSERGWGKLLFALAAFLILPTVPQLRALLPVERTIVLLVPALAACCLVGWWAGGKLLTAVVWVGFAVLLAVQKSASPDTFQNLARGWSLLLAGAFGLVCLFGVRRPLFARALVALGVALTLATMMSALGPVTPAHVQRAVGSELARRNGETMGLINGFIEQHPGEWNDLIKKVPSMGTVPAETEKQLATLSQAGAGLYPALLALESIMALALAWAMYHRLSRARLGNPLQPLREFRFNDQLVWGLITGLTIVFLPTLQSFRGLGRNLLLFFGALYAIRGLGVLAWFLAPGALVMGLTVGFAMLWLPVLQFFSALGFLMLGIAAFGLGLGDTWADWRRRARSTS